MPRILLLLLIASFVSCGDNSSNSGAMGGKEVIDFPILIQDKLSPQEKRELVAVLAQNYGEPKLGQVTITKTTGKEPDFDNWQSETEKVELKNVNRLMTEIVLNIQGVDLYIYEIEEDLIKKTKTVRVNLESERLKKMEERLLSSNMSLNGDNLNFSNEETKNQSTVVMNGNVSVSTPCSMSIHFGVKANKLPAFSHKSTTNCGKNYSKIELKALDLSNIEFCDEYCVTKDLSYLTENL